jgi:hypothetical protein
MESFESWLLRRVAQAVEAGEVSVDLLTELQAEFAAARERPQAQSHADSVLDIALELAMPVEEVETGLAALEAQPGAIQDIFLRRIAEAWLEGRSKVLSSFPPGSQGGQGIAAAPKGNA